MGFQDPSYLIKTPLLSRHPNIPGSPGQSELHSETLSLKKGTEPGGRSKKRRKKKEREKKGGERRKEEGGSRGRRVGEEEEGWVRKRQYGTGDMLSRETLGPQSLLPPLLPGWHKVSSLLDLGLPWFTGGPKPMVQTSHGQKPQA